MAVNAIYKQYNGSEWVEYYFKTSAAQVGVSSTRKFVTSSVKVNNVGFTLDATGDGASITINGNDINWFNGTKPSTNYLTDANTIKAALQALDTAAKSAYDHVPTGCVTYSNGGAFNTLFPDLYAIEGLSGTSGLLKKTAANTWALDTNSYVTTARKINNKALSSDVTLYGTDIAMSSTDSTTLKAAIDNVVAVANGKTNTYAISISATGTNLNAQFDSTNDTLEVLATGSNSVIKLTNGTTIDISNLKVGDIILTSTQDTADWWYSGDHFTQTGRGTVYTFFKMAMESVELTFSSILNKPTTISGYGITDCSLNATTGAITIGSVTKTPLYSHQSLASVVPYTGATGDVNLGTHKLTAQKFDGSFVTKPQTAGTHSGKYMEISNISITFVDANDNNQPYADLYFPDNQQGETLATQEWSSAKFSKCSYGATAPTSPKAGDVWVDTNN